MSESVGSSGGTYGAVVLVDLLYAVLLVLAAVQVLSKWGKAMWAKVLQGHVRWVKVR